MILLSIFNSNLRRPTKAINCGLYRYGRLPDYLYDEYIENKKIIIVGPAGYLQGKGLGKYIDSFDIVVRINHAIPILNKIDYGARTDVLYHILSRRGKDGIHKKYITEEEIKEWKKNKVVWLISRHDDRSKRIQALKHYLNGNVDWITIKSNFYNKLKKETGKAPNTGILTIMHILSLKPKTVNVIGFDFYKSGVYEKYGDIKDNENAGVVNAVWHDVEEQIIYLKKILQENDNLIIDDYFKDVIYKKEVAK